MDMDIKLNETFNLNSNILGGEFDLRENKEIKLFGVKLFINSIPEVYNFDSIESLFQFGENIDNYYCYLQYNLNQIFLLEKDANQDITQRRNIYNINKEWNLFLNSKGNIVVQQNISPRITSTFKRFPQDEYFFVSLSYLYYCLRNHSFKSKIDLQTKFESLINEADRK
jgi:hypothetical protein